MKLRDILEDITQRELYTAERFANDLWNKLGIDVKFSSHFVDQVNLPRNQPPIYIDDIIDMFRKAYRQHTGDISKIPDQDEGVLKDVFTKLNLPFVITHEYGGKTLIAKSTMRKKDFTTYPKDHVFVLK